jgi:hypothetical protein
MFLCPKDIRKNRQHYNAIVSTEVSVFCLDKLLEPAVGVFFVLLSSPIFGSCSLLHVLLQAFTSHQPQPQRHSLYVSFVHVAAGTINTTISFLTQRSGVKGIPRHRLAWHGPWVNDQGRSKTLSLVKSVACLSRFTDLVSPLQRLAEFKVKVAKGIPTRSRG